MRIELTNEDVREIVKSWIAKRLNIQPSDITYEYTNYYHIADNAFLREIDNNKIKVEGGRIWVKD